MSDDAIGAIAETLRRGDVRYAFGRAAVMCLGEEIVRLRARVAELEAGLRSGRVAEGVGAVTGGSRP